MATDTIPVRAAHQTWVFLKDTLEYIKGNLCIDERALATPNPVDRNAIFRQDIPPALMYTACAAADLTYNKFFDASKFISVTRFQQAAKRMGSRMSKNLLSVVKGHGAIFGIERAQHQILATSLDNPAIGFVSGVPNSMITGDKLRQRADSNT